MDSKALLNVVDYIGLITKMQTLQILGFILAASALIILVGAFALRQRTVPRVVSYSTSMLILASLLLGAYPDVARVFVKFSLNYDDLGGVLAIDRSLFLFYLVQIAMAAIALLGAAAAATEVFGRR